MLRHKARAGRICVWLQRSSWQDMQSSPLPLQQLMSTAHEHGDPAGAQSACAAQCAPDNLSAPADGGRGTPCDAAQPGGRHAHDGVLLLCLGQRS